MEQSQYTNCWRQKKHKQHTELEMHVFAHMNKIPLLIHIHFDPCETNQNDTG